MNEPAPAAAVNSDQGHGTDHPRHTKESDPMTTLTLPTVSVLDRCGPLEQAAYGFLAGCKTDKTRSAYQHDLKVFFAWCQTQGLPPLQAKRPHMELYVRTLQAGPLSQSTIQRRVSVVALFYRTAVIDEILDKDPCVALKRPALDRSRQRRTVLPVLAMARFLAASREDGPMTLAMAMLLGVCGLRIGEACSLNIEDMTDLGGHDVLHFIGKGDKYAQVVLPVPVLRAVRAAIDGRTTGPILLNQWGNRMDRKAAGRLIRRIAENACIDTDISPHSFRRTMVTTLLQLGTPLHQVQKAARHADPKTTLLYDRSSALDNSAIHQVAGFYSQWA